MPSELQTLTHASKSPQDRVTQSFYVCQNIFLPEKRLEKDDHREQDVEGVEALTQKAPLCTQPGGGCTGCC